MIDEIERNWLNDIKIKSILINLEEKLVHLDNPIKLVEAASKAVKKNFPDTIKIVSN